MIAKLELIFNSLAHALALGSFIFSGFMGWYHFDTLNAVQVSYLDKMLFYAAPLFALKISDVVTAFKNNGGQQ